MNTKLTTLLLFSIILLTTACEKTSNSKSDESYTLHNESSKKLNFIIYKTEQDYNEAKNAIYKAVLQPNTNHKVNTPQISGYGEYYLDWYTDDYQYTNWRYGSIPYEHASHKQIFIDDNSSFTVKDENLRKIIGRVVWLGNSGQYLSTWKPVDALELISYQNYGKSVWDQVGKEVKERTRITLAKSFDADIVVDNVYSFDVSKIRYNHQDDILEDRTQVNLSTEYTLYGNYSPSEKKFVTRVTDTAIFYNSRITTDKNYVLIMAKTHSQ